VGNHYAEENIVGGMSPDGSFNAVIKNCNDSKDKAEKHILGHHGQEPEFLDLRIK